MANNRRKTGEKPAFDTDQAWERFEKMVVKEPVPAFWKQEEEGLRSTNMRFEAQFELNHDDHEKDGTFKMKQSEAFRENTIKDKFTDSTWRTERPINRRLRRLTAGVAAAAVAIGLFTTPLGDRALAGLMQTFRIQHVVGVGISADDMVTISHLLEHGSPEGDQSFNLAQYGTMHQSGGGEAYTVTWTEAEHRMGAPLIKLENSIEPKYEPAGTLTFKLNVAAVNRLLTRLGSATTLPAEADGQAIHLHIPDGIVTEGTMSGKPARLLQYGKPVLTVDDDIDPVKVRDAVLGLPVLPDSLRTKLAAIGDWQSTLPVPTREGVSANLRFAGHDAILTEDNGRRLLFWVEGDRMGLLSAAKEDFPAASAFLQAAEELVRP